MIIKARVKKWSEIESGLDDESRLDGTSFQSSMKGYCGRVIEVKKDSRHDKAARTRYYGVDWCWHPDWLDIKSEAGNNICTHCTFKGDMQACLSAECHQHESWYALEQSRRISELEKRIEHMENIMRKISEFSKDVTL